MDDASLNFSEIRKSFGPVPIEKCDSPIEDVFLWEFHKVAHDDIRFWRQYECDTPIGRFRIDFVVESPIDRTLIGIECDGRDFHSAAADGKRDAAIVGAGAVKKVYRLRGQDIFYRIHDVFQLLRSIEPWLFSERGAAIIDQLATASNLVEDSSYPVKHHFPFTIFREYELPDSEDERPQISTVPLIIYWTA